MQVVPAELAGSPVSIQPRGGEDPLPHPRASGVRVLSGQRGRKLDPAGAALEVALVLGATPIELPREVRLDYGRQHGHPILVGLGATNDDLVGREIDVLDT